MIVEIVIVIAMLILIEVEMEIGIMGMVIMRKGERIEGRKEGKKERRRSYA